jgi:hypothetical protein
MSERSSGTVKEWDYDQPPPIDTARSQLILFVGRKGSGKSNAARLIYREWPHDKVCIDVHGDADPGEDAQKLSYPLSRMPDREDDNKPLNLYYKVDSGAEDAREQQDNALAMALYPSDRPGLFWHDEWWRLAKSNQLLPHTERALGEARHHKLSGLMCCPRPIKIDPLTIAQSDLVYVYDVPQAKDRQTIAENIGWPTDLFHAEHQETLRRGPFWHLRYDARTHELIRCPPLPLLPAAHNKPS